MCTATTATNEKLNKIDRKFLRNARKTANKYNNANGFIQFFVCLYLYAYYFVYRWIVKAFARLASNKYSKYFIILPTMAIITGILCAKIYGYVDSFGEKDLGRQKYFTQYEVQNGDTIWDISSDMVKINPEYNSVRAYAAEVMQINHCGENITSGNILILPYYSTTKEQTDIIIKYITNDIK